METTDRDLIARARAGEKTAFSRLIDHHQARAVRVALGMVANEAVAQELAQEAMLQAYLSLHRLEDDDRFASWLHGIVLNLCRSYLRDEKRRGLAFEALSEEMPAPASTADPGAIAEQRERERLIREAVDTLSPPNREATRLFYFEQLSLREIAATLGVSVGAVKVRLHQSRRKLRERLLPLYPEARSEILKTRRRKKMVNVNIAPHVLDSHPLDREAPGASEEHARRFLQRMIMSNAPANPGEHVGLMEEGGSRFVPLPVGKVATAIARTGKRDSAGATPVLPLLLDLLAAGSTTLEAVRIEPLSDGIYHATVQIRQAGQAQTVDARPADGIALAVQAGLPISLAEEVLQRDAWDLAGARGIADRLSHTADATFLRQAAEEPFLHRIADGILENLRRRIPAGEAPAGAEWTLEPQQWGGRDGIFPTHVQMTFHSDGGSTGGGNVAMPLSVLPALIARYKQMTALDLAERTAPQQGGTTVHLQGRDYQLHVSTGSTPLREKVTLRLQG